MNTILQLKVTTMLSEEEQFSENSPYGSQEEWDALTSQEQEDQWDSFHELNAAGTADELYFYSVMMQRYLADYVGH